MFFIHANLNSKEIFVFDINKINLGIQKILEFKPSSLFGVVSTWTFLFTKYSINVLHGLGIHVKLTL